MNDFRREWAAVRLTADARLSFKMGHTLAERQIEEDLDKADQIAAAAASMTVEQVLADVDIKTLT